MKKYLAIAALLVVAACGKKEEAAPADAAPTVAPAPAADSAAPAMDTTMARDSAHSM